VTTTQSFASAIAATIMSIALLGLPAFVPFAMILPQISAAFPLDSSHMYAFFGFAAGAGESGGG
jgi:hypothetical protein